MILRLFTLGFWLATLVTWEPKATANRSKIERRVSGGNVFGRGGLPVQKRSQSSERFPANEDVLSFVLRLVIREERLIEPDGSE